ncbi:MAG: sigma-70 family RNA polymerase sigma factor [Thermomicrobiales bacterium]|nr:sigma-70 family RNA polymerase sigma factor [Thermomicrobiales bacterium]
MVAAISPRLNRAIATVPVDASDAALVALAQTGSRAAFDLLVERHYPAIHRYLLRRCSSSDLADDLVQETFLDAWRDLDHLHDGDAIRQWLYRIARNNLMPTWRQRRVDSMDDLVERGAVSSASLRNADHAEDCVVREDVVHALNRLSGSACEALVLHTVIGMSSEEVGVHLGISREAAKKRIGRAKADFRKEYVPVW